MHILLDLFLTFLKVGAVSFGGGYGMIALLKEEVVGHGWLTAEEFLNFVGLAESTPGPIAINMATFVGASEFGILGAFLSTLGVVLPSFIIILVIASVFSKLLQFAGVKAFLNGIKPVVMGLILATGITLSLSVIIGINNVNDAFVFDWKALVIFVFVSATYVVYKKIKKFTISPILLILLSAVLGMLLYGLPI